jgi:hypothetical protein
MKEYDDMNVEEQEELLASIYKEMYGNREEEYIIFDDEDNNYII